MRCFRCGAPVSGQFCANCGAAMAPQTAPPTPPPAKSSTGWLLVAGLASGVVLALVVGLAFALGGRFSDDRGGGQVTSPTDTSSPTAATKEKKRKTASPSKAGPGDVRNLRTNLFCRDLLAQGYSYTASVDYWRMHGQPDQMDADRNGIPCETVYPADRVQAYWGSRMPAPDAPVYVPPTTQTYLDLPSGLFCRDLYSRGFSYGDALSYWYSSGMPAQMDADKNGIPCETVYPASTVNLYW